MAFNRASMEAAPVGLGRLATASNEAIKRTALHLVAAFPEVNRGAVVYREPVSTQTIGDQDYDLYDVDTRFIYPASWQRALSAFPHLVVGHAIVRRQELERREPTAEPEDHFELHGDSVGRVALSLGMPHEEHPELAIKLGIDTSGAVLMPNLFLGDYQRADRLAFEGTFTVGDARKKYINAYRGALVVAATVAEAGAYFGIPNVFDNELAGLFMAWSFRPIDLQVPETPNDPREQYVLTWARQQLPEF